MQVADRSSNKNEQIVHAAEVIGKSKNKRLVFEAIYTGKTKRKGVDALMSATGLEHRRVLDAGKVLADNDLVKQTKVGGLTAYEKIDFFQRYRDNILKASVDRKALAKIPTKRNAGTKVGAMISVAIRAPKKLHTKRITVDDVESFSAVRRIAHDLDYVRIAETKFKNGVAKILNEKGKFADWGGELRDLSSTRFKLEGKRRMVAFAFKGPGMTGRLTPGKMGKNGDQIQRLARCPADVFLVQYWAEIDDSVVEQLERLIQVKSYLEDRPLWYGIIDGQDSARLMQAYPKHF